jgi:hypothetical protein
MAKGTGRRSPLQLDKRLRDWLHSPQERALRERLRRIPKLGFPPDDDEQPEPPPPKRKSGGGRHRKLTPDEIERLQAAYKAANPKRKQHDVFDDLRKLLGRYVGDTTLREYIVRPRPRK